MYVQLAWLKAAGFTVLTADNGEVALELSRNHSGIIHLLLADVAMPRVSSLELCRIVVAERPSIKLLIFPQKPFGPEALQDSIETPSCRSRIES